MEAERAPRPPDYSVRRSARARRSRLTITDDGRAVVVLPTRAPLRVADELVARHWRWIDRHQRRIVDQREAFAARPALAAGREILYRGEPHRVVSIAAIDGRRRTTVRIEDRRIVVISPPLEARSTASLLEAWLRSEARSTLKNVVRHRAAEMELSPIRLTVRDQKTRWGSASRRGTLSFSWRLVLCPPWVLEYVAVHELAHLRVPGHSRAFWELVDRHFTDSRAARRWLRDNHDEVRRALD